MHTILHAAVPPAQAAAELATALIPGILAALRAAPVLADGTAAETRARLSVENAAMAATIAMPASTAVSGMARRCAAPRLAVRGSLTLGVWEARSRLVVP